MVEVHFIMNFPTLTNIDPPRITTKIFKFPQLTIGHWLVVIIFLFFVLLLGFMLPLLMLILTIIFLGFESIFSFVPSSLVILLILFVVVILLLTIVVTSLPELVPYSLLLVHIKLLLLIMRLSNFLLGPSFLIISFSASVLVLHDEASLL